LLGDFGLAANFRGATASAKARADDCASAGQDAVDGDDDPQELTHGVGTTLYASDLVNCGFWMILMMLMLSRKLMSSS
jgi:hypothetical protein